MFGSSNKQVVFNPSVYGNTRRNRRMPRWLITFLAGVIIGGGGFWFLQTNYGPPRLSIEESNRLNSTISQLNQEKSSLQQQLSDSQQALSQARDTIKQLSPVTTTQTENSAVAVNNDPSLNPITPIKEGTSGVNMEEVLKNLPPDPSNNPIGIRIGNFQGEIGQLSYELILTKSDLSSPNVPARVEVLATGRYKNGNKGFDHIQPINITANEYVRLQGKVELTKKTLTPNAVEVKVINTQTRKVLGSRTFEVRPAEAGTTTTETTTAPAN
ncbi:hypothetical protein V757_08060 [Pelistega indica]|uniref:Uncharacterized protein n=1 Tax=Pelistega indica TaxID=1414851 RepID=V8G107_9BURK|nr:MULTISPECIES: hypothetical protein [Pelistega]ETD70199.1 hypothetical protein V757_08060 [Pelistega indica]